MNTAIDGLAEKKRENKITGFNVRILDDDTFLMRTANTDYSMEEEYSYANMAELQKGIETMTGKINKHNSLANVLEKKKER